DQFAHLLDTAHHHIPRGYRSRHHTRASAARASASGRGTATPGATAGQPRIAPELRYTMNTAHGSLLIVEDDRQIRLLLAARLKSAGHVTAMAENGQQALEMLRAQPFDLVLLDLLMPEMDGYQVLAHLQTDDP